MNQKQKMLFLGLGLGRANLRVFYFSICGGAYIHVYTHTQIVPSLTCSKQTRVWQFGKLPVGGTFPRF